MKPILIKQIDIYMVRGHKCVLLLCLHYGKKTKLAFILALILTIVICSAAAGTSHSITFFEKINKFPSNSNE